MKTVSMIFGLLLLHLPGAAQEIRSHGHPPLQLASHRPTIWHPPLKTSWQWQLTTPVDENVKVQMYDIDMFDNNASVGAGIMALSVSKERRTGLAPFQTECVLSKITVSGCPNTPQRSPV